jgi:hypothetical protein
MASNTYPVDYGFKVSVCLMRDTEKDTVRVKVIAPMYSQKEWSMDHCYACSFTDGQILHDSDFIRVMSRAYPPN